MSETQKRPPVFWRLRAVMAVLIIAGLIAGCATRAPASTPLSTPSGNLPTNGLVQSMVGKAVTIEVKWLGPKKSVLAFGVDMNTHSVDLDSYDLMKLAVLRDDGGREYRPVVWDSAPGGHHRSGTLTFPIPDSLSQGKARYLEMALRDIDGIKEQRLKWEL